LLGLQLGQRLDSHDEPRPLQRLHETYLRELGAAWHNPGPFLALIATAAGKQACVKYLKNALRDDLAVLGYEKGLTGWWLKRRLRSGAPWGSKEPRTTLFATCWLELFPEARFLHVVRNPLAVAKSIQNRELEFQAKGDAPSGRLHDFDYCIDLAMIYLEAAEALAAQTSNYLWVRFEDIQADPVGQLKKLAGFSELRFRAGQMKRAAATIRPTRSDTLEHVAEKRELLARYPIAAKLGYRADSVDVALPGTP
jgi:hypothetical protein